MARVKRHSGNSKSIDPGPNAYLDSSLRRRDVIQQAAKARRKLMSATLVPALLIFSSAHLKKERDGAVDKAAGRHQRHVDIVDAVRRQLDADESKPQIEGSRPQRGDLQARRARVVQKTFCRY